MNQTEFIEKFLRARKAGTPIFGITTFDPAETMISLQRAMNTPEEDDDNGVPIVFWDCVKGWIGRNRIGIKAIDKALHSGNLEDYSVSYPLESLKAAMAFPENTVYFVLNPQHYMEQPGWLQALWNLRDEYKADGRSVVLLGPDFNPPAQIRQDIFMMDEPLPSDDELARVVTDVITEVGLQIKKKEVDKAVDAIRGLSLFPAEQSVAMNVRKTGLDIAGLWDRKQKLISSTPGLKIYSGQEKFEDLGGCASVKKFMKGILDGKDAPNVIILIDEGEKMFAGATGAATDSSGVSQDYLATTLSYMEDNEADGSIFIGPPGAAKSAIAKAMGNEAGIPTIFLDLGGMKGSLVGKSEAQLRNAYKVISAVGGGKVFFIMTCNRIVDLPPELKRRFTSGTFFFDLPNQEEREMIWPIYVKKFDIDSYVPENEWDLANGWTGAEIRNCCRLAYRQNISLIEAAKYIVPVSVSAGEQINALRKQASGAYLSANEPGIYRWEDANIKSVARPRTRKLDLD
jgi:hypothetical protein